MNEDLASVRLLQESSVTAKTQGSTQHSDDHHLTGGGNSPIEKPIGLRRNFSNNTRDSDQSRSRGISGMSGDLIMNKTQTSHSSNSSLHHKHTVADKVRQVHCAKHRTPERPREANEELHEEDKINSNTLSPNQMRMLNHRSHSFSREPRSPSWNKANFDSSANASQLSKDTPVDFKSNGSDSESLASETQICDVNCPVYNHE